jgi:hypothetical protein
MQALDELLGVSGKSFCCLFHDDNNPSASIFAIKKNGHYIYKCHSSNCDFRIGTITKCVERILGCNRLEAIHFLMDVYDIQLCESDWQKQQKALLDENMRYLYSDEFEFEYSELFLLIRRYYPYLNMMHTKAKQHLSNQNIVDEKAIFFASGRYLAGLMGHRSDRYVNKIINLCVYAKLLIKLNDNEIPQHLLEKSEKHRNVNIISYYSIPSYSDRVLTESNQRALLFKEKSCSIRGFNREMLLGFMDKQEVDEVYPQEANKAIPRLNIEVSRQMEKIALQELEEKGWTTEKKVLEQTKLYFRGQQQYKETLLKSHLPEIKDKYCLERLKLSKNLKLKLNIKSEGYFYVIIHEGIDT